MEQLGCGQPGQLTALPEPRQELLSLQAAQQSWRFLDAQFNLFCISHAEKPEEVPA